MSQHPSSVVVDLERLHKFGRVDVDVQGRVCAQEASAEDLQARAKAAGDLLPSFQGDLVAVGAWVPYESTFLPDATTFQSELVSGGARAGEAN